ncbi:HCc2 [Symbiodinium sp. CCMP2592]|nr:HCc2 [Symbiodinium sp. CCMP2592]
MLGPIPRLGLPSEVPRLYYVMEGCGDDGNRGLRYGHAEAIPLHMRWWLTSHGLAPAVYQAMRGKSGAEGIEAPVAVGKFLAPPPCGEGCAQCSTAFPSTQRLAGVVRVGERTAVVCSQVLPTLLPKKFVSPVKIGVSVGPAPVSLLLKEPNCLRFGDCWLGKELSRALDEVRFHGKCLNPGRSATVEMQSLLRFMIEYASVPDCEKHFVRLLVSESPRRRRSVRDMKELEDHFVTEAFLPVESANVMQTAAGRSTSSPAGVLMCPMQPRGSAAEGPDGSIPVAEQLPPAAVAAVDAAVAAPPSTAAATEVVEEDAFAVPRPAVSFTEMGANAATVVAVESSGQGDAVVHIVEVAGAILRWLDGLRCGQPRWLCC